MHSFIPNSSLNNFTINILNKYFFCDILHIYNAYDVYLIALLHLKKHFLSFFLNNIRNKGNYFIIF